MAFKITRWRPDTCDCIVEYEWDDSLSPENVTHSLSRIVRRCSVHQGMANDTAVWNTIKEENPRKNITNQLLLDNAPSSVFDLESDGNRVFKKGISVSWAWSGTPPNRLLTITVIGITLTTNQKNAVQTKLNERFGISNVVII